MSAHSCKYWLTASGFNLQKSDVAHVVELSTLDGMVASLIPPEVLGCP